MKINLQPYGIHNLSIRKVHAEGTKSMGRDKKTWNECVTVDMNRLGLVKVDAHNRDYKWRSLTTGNGPTLPQCGNSGCGHL